MNAWTQSRALTDGEVFVLGMAAGAFLILVILYTILRRLRR
jgi:hypothetical protein